MSIHMQSAVSAPRSDEYLDMCTKLVEGLNMQRTLMRPATTHGGDGEKGKGATPRKVGTFPSLELKGCSRCSTGKTSHSSGICLVCKNKGIEGARARRGPSP